MHSHTRSEIGEEVHDQNTCVHNTDVHMLYFEYKYKLLLIVNPNIMKIGLYLQFKSQYYDGKHIF